MAPLNFVDMFDTFDTRKIINSGLIEPNNRAWNADFFLAVWKFDTKSRSTHVFSSFLRLLKTATVKFDTKSVNKKKLFTHKKSFNLRDIFLNIDQKHKNFPLRGPGKEERQENHWFLLVENFLLNKSSDNKKKTLLPGT